MLFRSEQVPGTRVLDLYAGTGALGLEAASRGAAAVTFVESSRRALAALETNLAAYRRAAPDQPPPEVLPVKAEVALQRLAASETRFDLVFADPPYGDHARELLANRQLPGLLTATGRLVLESARRDTLNPSAPWVVERERVYGDTRVTILTLKTSH